MEEIQKALQEKIDALKKNVKEQTVDKESFETSVKELKDLHEGLSEKYVEKSIVEDLNKQIEGLNEKVEAMKQTKKQAESFVDLAVKNASDLLKSYKEKGHKVGTDMNLKDVIDMGTSNAITGQIPMDDREPGLNYEPRRQPVMLNLIQSGSTNSDTVSWVEKTDQEGAPAFKKEFEVYPSRSWKSVLRTEAVKKIGVLAEYSSEITEDVDYFESELRRDLVEMIQLELDKKIWEGDGGDTEIKGIKEHVQAWSNVFGTDTITVAEPSIYDVLAVAVNQIRVEHHNPTVIVMSPTTAMEMKLTKDENHNYVMPPFAAANGVQVEGLPVVTNTLLDNGEILVMDGSKAQFLWKRNWRLEISDSHDANFAKDMLAVRLTGRGVLKVKNTDAKAFVHVADVSDAITAMTPSS